MPKKSSRMGISFLNTRSSEPEVILIKNLSDGNILAFNSLYSKYCRRIYIFAYGYLKSKADTEELVQEVFTIIWEKRKSLNQDLSFKAFLFTIALNIIRKHFRENHYIGQYIKTMKSSDSDNNTNDDIEMNSLSDYIYDLVEKLPARRKEIFIKSRYQGLSIKEISSAMSISHKTVENQLSTALKFFKTELDREKSVKG